MQVADQNHENMQAAEPQKHASNTGDPWKHASSKSMDSSSRFMQLKYIVQAVVTKIQAVVLKPSKHVTGRDCINTRLLAQAHLSSEKASFSAACMESCKQCCYR